MKKLTVALISALALGSSVAYAADGGDRTFNLSAAHMKVAMESYAANQAQMSSSTQIANTVQAETVIPATPVQK